MESCLALEYIQLNNTVEQAFYVSTVKDRHYIHMIVILGTFNINRNREHSFVILSKCMWDFILFYSHKPLRKLKIAIIKGSPNENYFFDCQRMKCFYFICIWALLSALWTFLSASINKGGLCLNLLQSEFYLFKNNFIVEISTKCTSWFSLSGFC